MKVKLALPYSLNDISLAKHQEFVSIQNGNEDDRFITEKMISIFCNIKMSEVGIIKYDSILTVVEYLAGLMEGEKKFIPTFKLGGKEFGFVPSLEDMTLDEYIDLDTNIDDWVKFHKAMAVLYRPIIKKQGDQYEIEPYVNNANYSDVMKHAPLDVAMGAKVFFYHLKNELLKATVAYLKKEAKSLSIQHKRSLTKSGVGTTASMDLLEEMSANLKRLENFHLDSASHGLFTKATE